MSKNSWIALMDGEGGSLINPKAAGGGDGDNPPASGSLINPKAAGGGDGDNPPANGGDNAQNNGDNVDPQDPFKDLAEFKDENGLYMGKYKTIVDAFRGHKELYAAYSQKSAKAPEQYEALDFSDSSNERLKGMKVTADDPAVAPFLPVLKKHNITQEGFKELAAIYLENQLSSVPDPKVEMQKLGSDGKTIVAEVSAFVAKNFDEDEKAILAALCTTAAGVRLVHKWAKATGEKPVPGRVDGGAGAKSWQELEQEAFKYKKDNPDIDSKPAKQQIYQNMMMQAQKLKLGLRV